MDQAIALAQIERRLVLKRINRMGIRLVDWHIDQPLSQVLNASLNTRTALRHRANIRRGRENR